VPCSAGIGSGTAELTLANLLREDEFDRIASNHEFIELKGLFESDYYYYSIDVDQMFLCTKYTVYKIIKIIHKFIRTS
jgi:hypothetical protein